MSPSAYDTAWLARIPGPAGGRAPLFPSAHGWLLDHQRPDGSWGAEIPFAHDRIVATLAALITLTGSEYREDESQVAARRALVYLTRRQADLQADPAETVGFELIFPELMRQARALDLHLPYEDWAFVEKIQTDKLKRIPPVALYGGPTPLSHSLEYLGDRLIALLAPRCRLADGSYGVSPSATAYVHARLPSDETAGYLHRVAALDPTGGIPYVHPFETFEASWVLRLLDSLVVGAPEAAPLLDRLERAWTASGVTWTGESSVPDADDTAVALSVLRRHGREGDPSVLAQFEADDRFHTFVYERNSSVTTNAHVLDALRQFPSTPDSRRMTLKVVRYLRRARGPEGNWTDKWHASPFYATDRAVQALAGLAEDLVRPAVEWTIAQQHEGGAWGFADGTVEETAWALHTLVVGGRADPSLRALSAEAVDRGVRYLADHIGEEEHPALWIGKTLYTPRNIVRAIVIAALAGGRSLTEAAA